MTWFFVLKPGPPGYRGSDPINEYLFSSYYNAVGPMHGRPLRGTSSRPTVAQTYRYRAQIDEAIPRRGMAYRRLLDEHARGWCAAFALEIADGAS